MTRTELLLFALAGWTMLGVCAAILGVVRCARALARPFRRRRGA
jgi:F0F1-type ATP synthase assembly protein I